MDRSMTVRESSASDRPRDGDRGFPSGAKREGRMLLACGVAALAGYAIHGVFHLRHGRPEDLLWTCHLGAALVGVGLIAASGRRAWGASVDGVGALWLLLGTPLWLLDLAGGGEFFPTSLGTHVVGLAMGLVGVWKLGMPRGTWWKATAALVALMGLCRLVTPREANVNVAFAIQHGWEEHFASHASYLACMIAFAAGYFWLIERLWRFGSARVRLR
jgi:hypothetical protein